MASRTFHVLYLPDGLMASCIDAIRAFANPAEKSRAHITVGGPYGGKRKDVSGSSRIVEGSEINIDGPGNFFDSGQNTVYLRCRSPKLEDVWDKYDYGFNPHITLYDGSSREFSKRLWEIVSGRTYKLSFIAGPLKPLKSSQPRQGGMELQADLDVRLVRAVTGLDMNSDKVTVESLGQDERLRVIDKLCDYLSRVDSGATPSIDQETTKGLAGLKIEEVDIASQTLRKIKALARKNSATLGFLPEGAFDAYAQRGWILAATADGEVAGYLVYRLSRMTAVLVHLCTDEKHRGQGIARQLFHCVVKRTNEQRGILANTRRDFPAHAVWPRLGFAAIGEGPGRGMNQSVLTRWWYEHPHPKLFSNSASHIGAQVPIDVAIDLNVFYDLVMPSSRKEANESRALRSDWLVDEIQLCVTGEIFNEINRLESPKVRQRQTNLAHYFKRISGTAESFHRIYGRLSSIMGRANDDRQSSDLRHLAHAAAADADFFVTQDAQILRYQEEVERKVGVTPLRPLDLLIQMDQVRNTASYQPARLRGSTLQVQKVERRQRQLLEDIFVNNAVGEKKSAFRARLASILPSPQAVDSQVVLSDGEPVALFGFAKYQPNVIEVPCLRLRGGRLARTLARQIVTMAVDSSIRDGVSMTAVTDDWLEPYVEEALAESGFVKSGLHWLKINYSFIGTEDGVSSGLAQLCERLQSSGLDLPGIQRFSLGTRLTAGETILVEKSLRPLKVTNGTLDTVVMPVMPRWAQHLFDSDLAEQTLFGVRPDLVFNWENAYYRSPRSLGDTSNPFRILWYVTRDKRYVGTGQIRGYSVGTDAEVLPARQAFNRYKRLGVYDWQQVLRISKGDPDGLVMVIRFCDTEIFDNPVDGNTFRALLELSDEKRPSLRGPQRISETAFAEIYSQGQS